MRCSLVVCFAFVVWLPIGAAELPEVKLRAAEMKARIAENTATIAATQDLLTKPGLRREDRLRYGLDLINLTAQRDALVAEAKLLEKVATAEIPEDVRKQIMIAQLDARTAAAGRTVELLKRESKDRPTEAALVLDLLAAEVEKTRLGGESRAIVEHRGSLTDAALELKLTRIRFDALRFHGAALAARAKDFRASGDEATLARLTAQQKLLETKVKSLEAEITQLEKRVNPKPKP